jgi:hypothetical protein
MPVCLIQSQTSKRCLLATLNRRTNPGRSSTDTSWVTAFSGKPRSNPVFSGRSAWSAASHHRRSDDGLRRHPIGQYRRSWLLIMIGIVFAAMGIISCIVPGILTGVIQMLVGLLNIIGGVVLLTKRFLPILHGMRNPRAEPVPSTPIIIKLLTTQTMVNIVGITSGITMLVPSLVSGLVIAGILVINRLLLFVLAYFLHKIP